MSELVIKISGDISDYKKKLQELEGQTDSLRESLSTVAKTSAVAFAALNGEVALSVRAFGEAQAAQNKLTNSMQNQGIYSAELLAAYKAQAEQLQALTGVDDDAVTAAQAVLQSMIGQTAITYDLSKAILDLADAKDMDLNSTAQLIGKGIQGHVTALQKLGIEIDENLSKEQRTAEIIRQVNVHMADQAEITGKNVANFRSFQTAVGNLQEAIGAKFAPSVNAGKIALTSFITEIGKSDVVVGMIADNIKLGTAIAGVGAVAATAAIGFIKMKAAIEASSLAMRLFGTASRAALITSGIGIAVVALTEAMLYFANKSKESTDKATQSLKSHADEVKRLQGEIKKLEEEKPDLTKLSGFYLEHYEHQKRARLASLKDRLGKEVEMEKEFQREKAKMAGGNEEAAKDREREQLLLESRQAHQEALLAQAQGASEALISLKKQESETLKAMAETHDTDEYNALAARYNRLIELDASQQQIEFDQKKTFQEQVLADNEEYQQLTEEQKADFLLRNQEQLQAEILTEEQIREQAAQRRAQEQIKANNQFLIDQQKFGTAYATINKAMHSDVYQGTKKAFGEMAEMQQSSNATLKGIGKAAAIANIIIKTAESAMNIYTGFSAIPFIGQALGVAGAAAAIAFGAEQIGRVTAAADGGLLTGGIPGKDSIPVLGMPGEIVVPTRNYDELIDAVAQARGYAPPIDDQAPAGGVAHVVLELRDNLVEFIEAKLVERQRLGFSVAGG